MADALRVFASGPSGSGKSRALHALWTSRTPRVISLDLTGEVQDRNPSAIRTYGLEQLRRELIRVAHQRRSWHIAAFLEDAELPRFFAMLAPPIRSDDATSYTRLVGGVALECGEASWLAPNAGIKPEIRAAITRGRHYGISLYMAAQRPAHVDRCVTSEAHALLAFRHWEKRDLAFWADHISSGVADVIAELPLYHCVYFLPSSGKVQVLDADYRVYRILDPRGRETASSRPRLLERA